jgi:serine/threonine protein kinase
MSELELGIEAGELDGAESLSPVATGERNFGRYLLQYEIASGGMASVYLARSLGAAGFERPIAIKRIHPHLAKKQVFVEMFLDEARLNARIAHPNVCNVFDFGEADGSYFMAMEYLVGQPLSRVLGSVAARPELLASLRWHALAARILADACQGLHAAHELLDEHGYPLQVVHRDFTPHNVFVTYDGAVKVFDFGVARAEGRLHQTETGMLKGKLAYMSPEQLSRASVDRRLDVWAAGVCLWELLTLRRLFARRSELETVQAIATEEILRPSEVRAGVPRELDAITLRALDRDVDRRTTSARTLARELNQFVSTTGILTSMSDVAELMAELFPEERARKLGVVADVLKGQGALELGDASAVQRARANETRPGSVASPRASSRHPIARGRAGRPTTPVTGLLDPRWEAPELLGGGPGDSIEDAGLAPLAVEATTKSTFELADMLEPPSERSLELGLEAEARQERPAPAVASARVEPARVERSHRPMASRLVAVMLVALVGLAAVVLAIVAPGSTDPARTIRTGGAPVDGPGTKAPGHGPSAAHRETSSEPPHGTERSPDPEINPEEGELAGGFQPAVEPEDRAEPRPAQIGRGSVNVAARGGWADLLVDGRPVGRTPRRVSLAEGRHLLELRPPVGAAIRRYVTIRAGRTQRVVIDLD